MKTVKVKIPCIVDSEGNWNAVGCSHAPAEECLSWAFEGMEGSALEKVVWLNAEIAVPCETEVDASVEEA